MFPSNTLPKALIRPPRVNVLGVGIHALNMQMAVEFVEKCVFSGRKGYVCVTGVHGVMEASRNSKFRAILNQALLVTPDGMPTVWVGRLQRQRQMRRVFGPDFMSEVCARSVNGKYTHFLYGGKPGIAMELSKKLQKSFPGIQIVGTFTPPFRPLDEHEKVELRAKIADLRPDIVWVGMSTPKQEQFMAEMIGRLSCKVMIGVGAAFDIHTGKLRDAPNWIKNAGLQWLHRLCQEPTRLWKRYLINNTAFVWRIAQQAMGVRRYSLSAESLGSTLSPTLHSSAHPQIPAGKAETLLRH